MEIRHLRALVTVAEELHFGRAALRLNISQPPLSLQIQQLEKELGTQLFVRNRRSVRLTEAGKKIVTEARRALSQVDHISRVARKAADSEIDHLSIGMRLGTDRIPLDSLRLFCRTHPDVQIELRYMSTVHQIEALRNGQLRIGFISLPVEHDGLVIESLRKEPLRLAMPADHPLAQKKRIRWSALAGQPFVMFPRHVFPGLFDAITSACRNAGFALTIVHEVDNVLASLALVEAGLGMAFAAPHLVAGYPHLTLRPMDSPVETEFALAHRGDPESSTIEHFVEIVREVAREERRRGRTKRRSRPKP